LQSVQNIINEKSRDGLLRGRLIQKKGDSDLSALVVPYYSREEIDTTPVLKGQAKILCYVEPVDAFFLQIQGSGTVHLGKNKELRLGYAAQNGYTYKAIGKLLFDVIPKEQMTAQKIAAHLRTLPRADQQKILNQNPSYVFFQILEGSSKSYFGADVVPGRTIATDPKYFPKGALAFLEYDKPQFAEGVVDSAQSFSKSARFVLDQDTGGAIRGPHRVDLFWGSGPESERVSGVMRNNGRLYYILPRIKAL
jgi:membrane-bound lytic murein transglycosylase A